MRRTQKECGNTKSRLQLSRSESKSIPNTQKSSVSSTTVLPDPTEPNCPAIDRSSIRRCRFENLSPESCISRSTLSSVTITSGDQSESVSSFMIGSRNADVEGRGNSAHSAITRSALVSCSVSASTIDRCCMAHCTITNVRHISRTRASKAYVHDATHIERCSIGSGVRVMDGSSLERSELRDGSVVCGGSTVTDSTIGGGSVVRSSKIEYAKVEACEIVGCDIRGGKFEGMVLRGGIWKGGDLVGRNEDFHEELVVMAKEDWERRREAERRLQMEEQEVGEIEVSTSVVSTRTHDGYFALHGSSHSESLYPDHPTRSGCQSHNIEL